MNDLRCPRGHVVHDAEATECPTCGAMMFSAGRVGDGRGGASRGDASTGIALIVVGLVLSVLSVLLLVSGSDADDSTTTTGFSFLLGAVLGFLGSTAWLVGCIAEGVRIGRRIG